MADDEDNGSGSDASGGLRRGSGQARPRPLLVLDLDGTLLHALKKGDPRQYLLRRPHTTLRAHDVWYRPGLGAFLASARQRFGLAVWTAAPERYAADMIAAMAEHVQPDVPNLGLALECVLSEKDTDVEWKGAAVITKDLRKAAAATGRCVVQCLVVDDTPSTYALNQQNALPVPTFCGSAADDTLPALQAFLQALDLAQLDAPFNTIGAAWAHKSGPASGPSETTARPPPLELAPGGSGGCSWGAGGLGMSGAPAELTHGAGADGDGDGDGDDDDGGDDLL